MNITSRFYHDLFSAQALKAKKNLLNNPLPYYLNGGTGYRDDNMMGYQLYVLDGRDFILSSNSIKLRILDRNFRMAEWFPQAYKLMNARLFLRFSFDYGYANDPVFGIINQYSNTHQYGFGPAFDAILFNTMTFGQDTSAIEAEVRKINERIDQIGRDADESDVKQRDLLLSIPNLPHEACPVGHSAEENPEVRRWGKMPEFSFEPKDHTAVAGALGMIDFEAGVKITGSAFVVYKAAGARLERALINFLLDLHTTQHGYQEVSPPLLVKPDCLVGTSQLPKFGDQVYHSPLRTIFTSSRPPRCP